MKKKKMYRKTELKLLATLLFALPATLAAQNAVTEPADAGHAAGALHRMMLGSGYRDTWVVPITVPVLDIGTFAGGLKPFREGGNQSRTLRFQAGNGKVYQFRSTRKFLPRSMPDDLQDTPAGDVIHDQSSAMYPAGHLIVSALQQAVGVLHAVPQLVYLPDDPRLGEYRKTFGGMMGQIEERPQDYDDNKKLNFASAEKLEDPDDLLEKLEESLEHRIDQRDYLRARLMDIMVGDTDRGADQWVFARFEDEYDNEVYRAIPRDRDYAFMHSDGLLVRGASIFYKKLVRFGPKFDPLASYLFMTREFDRSHLNELTWADWDAMIKEFETRLSDAVIDDAIMRLPPEHRQLDGPKLTAALKQRRNDLREYARLYYFWMNEEASVFAADEDERADIERNADGSVTVRLFRKGKDSRPAFERRFMPDVTSEIRVFMERGNDRVLVRGGADRTIDVRVIGGEGNDILVDSTRMSRNETFTTFYDAHGQNTIVTGPHTRVSEKPYVTRAPARLDQEEEKDDKKPKRVLKEERRGRYQDQMNAGDGFIEQKTTAQLVRDWGQNKGFVPAFEIQEGSAIILGGGYQSLDFGFRRLPYETRFNLVGMVSPLTGRLGAQFQWDRHPENSRWGYSLLVRGTQFESNRFYGYGNDTPDQDVSSTLVVRDQVLVYPSLNYELGRFSRLSFGPVYKWNRAHPEEGGAADLLEPFGTTESISQIGARVETVINTAGLNNLYRKGFIVKAGASAYPAIQDMPESIQEVHGSVGTYISLGSPVLAVRAGGQKIWGDSIPLHEAAFLGGNTTLRGYRYNRFAGDASVFGGAELRIPITRAVIFTRGDLGIMALADAGRVSYAGESEGGWHTGFGGGVWFQTIGQLLTLTYAKGDDAGRVYFSVGAPFK